MTSRHWIRTLGGFCASTGVRFGQFTIFMPLLLKPAPTRLRLALWALEKGLDHVPDRPAARVGDDPRMKPNGPMATTTMSGYRPAASRAIRIDMLERLRTCCAGRTRGAGSRRRRTCCRYTGLTLEQFADLMGGLGYRADRGERPKVKAAPEPAPRNLARERDRDGNGARGHGRARDDRRNTAGRSALDRSGRGRYARSHAAGDPGRPAGRGPGHAVRGAGRASVRGFRGTRRPRRRPKPPPRFPAMRRPKPVRRPMPKRRSSIPSPGRRGVVAAIGRNAAPRELPPSPAARSRRAAESLVAKAVRRPGGPGGKGGKDRKERQDGPRTYSARPDKPAKVDPDNPFAVLAALKDKT